MTTASFSFKRTDPYSPPSDHLRVQHEEPVTQVPWRDGKTIWAITRYQDVRAVLSDTRFSSDRYLPGHPTNVKSLSTDGKPVRRSLIEMDPPDHTTARGRVMGEFTVKQIARLRPGVEVIVNDAIDAMIDGRSEADLVHALSLPVPSMVIAELLAIPYEDHDFFQTNSATFSEPEAPLEDKQAAIAAIRDYMIRIVDERVSTPGEDILSRQLAAGATPEEVANLGFLLLIAGHETTANMISLSVMTLLDKPELLQQLRDDPELIPKAVEELLRYFTIAEVGGLRLATADIEVDGTTIPAGDSIFALTNTANRDAEVFPDPHTIDFNRGARNHVAFGFGPHQCLGQNLARLELVVVLEAVIRRLPTLRLAIPFEEIRFKDGGANYGIYELPVAW